MRLRGQVLVGLTLTVAIGGSASGAERTAWVKLPPGTTRLRDIGAYGIAYQRTGQDVVEMPDGWTGFFTPEAGIAFRPERHGDRPALLLHCPWRGGTGAVFVEYPLELPRAEPITLSLGIAMRPDIVDQSDGVTFTVRLTCDGKARDLVHEHYTNAEPKDFRLDLTPLAGRRVTLRLQTEPGPDKTASFDFSRFVEPVITAGPPVDATAELIKAMTATKAYRALSQADLRAVGNRRDQGIAPSCKLPHETRARKAKPGYEFAYEGSDCRLVYRYVPKTGSLDDLTVQLDETKPFRPCAGGGVRFEIDGELVPPEHATLEAQSIEGDRVRATWRYRSGAETAVVKWVLRLVGKALVVGVESQDATVAKFTLGGLGAVAFRHTIPIPYLFHQDVYYVRPQGVFTLKYMDWTPSHASQAPGHEAIYTRKLDGNRNPLGEVGYVAVSPDLDEVLPNIPHPPSPYLDLLGPRMMVDIWGGQYERDAETLEIYKSYGIDQVAIIKHVWQRYGYDVKLPDHIPADPRYGGEAGMERLGATAKRLGYVFSLHENYIDLYPDAPSYDAKHVALGPNGKPWKAWYHKGTKVQSWGLKANSALQYAKQNSPEIHRRYHTTASYLDVHTCIEPWRYCDFDPTQPMAGMAACRREHQATLFQYMRATHGGPLFGEGYQHFFWAGLVDGVEAQVTGGEDCPVLVDFDLLKIHPQMVNHGMGYYTRWLRTGKQSKWGVNAGTPAQLDKYRAQELAYGHASFMGAQLWGAMPLVIREYHIAQPVHALYGNAKVTQIAYEVDGQWVTSSVAAVVGILDRLRVRYDSGLTLHVNLRADDWHVKDYVLPEFGFLAEGSDTLVYTALAHGVIVDFARTKDSLYVDSRAIFNDPYAHGRKNVEPRLKSFEHIGGRQFRISYEWKIGEKLDDDYTCFVHFTNEDAVTTAEGILFQNDHRPPKPTSQWQPGTTLVDGPYTVDVPEGLEADEATIVIGLAKGGRVKLRGTDAGSMRIAIGRLKMKRDADGAVVAVDQVGIADLQRRQRELRQRFRNRMNVAGKAIDFGPATTDGSFKIRVRKDSLELLPYPRDRQFNVQLDLGAILPGRRIATANVTGRDDAGKVLGKVDATLSGGTLRFRAGMKGVTRHIIQF